MVRYFSELEFSYTDAVVILDLDGTLVPDGAEMPEARVVRVVQALAQNNRVYLASNKSFAQREERLRLLSRTLGVGVANARFRKPNPRVLSGIDTKGKKIVVIGDKDLTDGLLARRVGGEYVKVRRLLGREPFAVKSINWLDDTLGVIVLALWDMCFS